MDVAELKVEDDYIKLFESNLFLCTFKISGKGLYRVNASFT